MLRVAPPVAMEPAGAGSQIPRSVANMKMNLAEFMTQHKPILQAHLKGILTDPRNYQFQYRDLFSAFFKIACSGLMAPAIHSLSEVMNEFFAEVKRSLATVDPAVLIAALIQFNQHYGLAERAIQPPLRPIETLPGTTFPFTTAGWFKAMRADQIFRNPVLQNNIATALGMLTLDSLANYDHESIRSLIIMLYDAEKQFAECNKELFRKFVPALSARRTMFTDPTPPQDPKQTFAWAVAEAKRLGIYDDDDVAFSSPFGINHQSSEDAMDTDSADQAPRRKRKHESISAPDELTSLSETYQPQPN